MKAKRGSVNSWTIVHIAAVHENTVEIEHQDARLNGKQFPKIEALAFAQPHWIYAVKFKSSEVVKAVELDRLV